MVGVTTFKQFTIGLIAFKIIHDWVDAFKQFTVGVHAFEINHDWGRCVQTIHGWGRCVQNNS